MTTAEPTIIVKDLWIRFLIRYFQREVTFRETLVRRFSWGGRSRQWREGFWALRGIDLVAYPGDVIGLIGPNGAGKTTLLKALAGVFSPDKGSVVMRGKIGCLLSFGLGFNPQLSGHENIYLNATLLGLTKQEIDEKLADIIAFSELAEFINAPVRTYSTGMRSRLGFAIAIQLEPDIILLDEALGAGDRGFRKRAGTTLAHMSDEKKTVVLANHNLKMIQESCNKVAWIDHGEVHMFGPPSEVLPEYRKAITESPDQITFANRPSKRAQMAKPRTNVATETPHR